MAGFGPRHMAQSKEKTDFKSIIYLMEEFLNYFDDSYIPQIVPMGTYFPQILEHNDIWWITPEEIPNYDFCPADEEILKRITEVCAT